MLPKIFTQQLQLKLSFPAIFGIVALVYSSQIYADCDPGFTFDSASFSLESVEDFENTGQTPPYDFDTLNLAGITVSGLDPNNPNAIGYGSSLSLKKDCGDQIPLATTFVQTFGNPIYVIPNTASSTMGFDFAHQDWDWYPEGNVAFIEVLDSNGVVHSCQAVSTPVTIDSCEYPWGGNYSQNGKAGFVGFNTNDPNVHIVSMSVQQPDGGIDNVRCTGCDGVVVAACSPETLKTDIQALQLGKGLENSLLVKLNAAVATKKSGVVNSSVGVYGALKNQISAKTPDPIPQTDADNLNQCIDELIDQLINP